METANSVQGAAGAGTPAPAVSPEAEKAVDAVANEASASHAAGKSQEALTALLDAAQKNPGAVNRLAQPFQKVILDLIPKAQNEIKTNPDAALATFRMVNAALANPAAKTMSSAYDRTAQTAREGWAEAAYQVAERTTRTPGMMKNAQDLLEEAVRANPANATYHFRLAEVSRANGNNALAAEQYQLAAAQPNAPPDIAQKSRDILRQIQVVNATPIPTQAPVTRPVATPLPRPVVTPPPVVATPAPAPEATPAPSGPWYKPERLLTTLKNNPVLDFVKGLPAMLGGGEYTTYLIAAPIFILVFWIIPYKFLQFRARRGDIIAGRYCDQAKRIGLIAFFMYLVGLVTAPKPKNRCPFCNKGIDNIDAYSDLNFLVCPHCRESITPIYDIKDYVTHLIHEVEVQAKKSKSGELDNKVERDAMLKLVRAILTLSLRRRASDLHLDSELDTGKLRARVDGVMYDLLLLPKAVTNAFISALKIMANLDITERRVPQDGKIGVWIDKNDLDLRINTSPAAMGEKVSIRILNQKTILADPTKLGLEGDNLEKYERSIRRPHGMIIVTGPSGSGKSTTLYCALNEINTGDKNIITLEDPIEYQVKGLTQMQVNVAANFTFATGLRSILRQDPDVIMVGEIRDKDTAEVAVEAAMTGHLVYTTLHTIDAPTAFSRLADLGIETKRLSSAVICILAQRLVRTICDECKRPYKPKKSDLELLGIANSAKDFTFVHGAGCDVCMNTGYHGRIGIFEFLAPDDSMREILETNAVVSVIRELARKSGYRTLREEGIIKVMNGITTVEEVIRVTS
ncbi:MAG: Flp pilus assembly complex ATPase component TadA [Candidatus Sumerlaeaceae bacterium]|nr:Flp pilus assembly complex ATPase component TadA [Candidatus Sumerlaeaceae bacterium]